MALTENRLIVKRLHNLTDDLSLAQSATFAIPSVDSDLHAYYIDYTAPRKGSQMAIYTVHTELDDCTIFAEPVFSSRSKREANRVASQCAKTPASDVISVLVMEGDMVVSEYKTKFTTRCPA